jgi:hypothetical protein
MGDGKIFVSIKKPIESEQRKGTDANQITNPNKLTNKKNILWIRMLY